MAEVSTDTSKERKKRRRKRSSSKEDNSGILSPRSKASRRKREKKNEKEEDSEAHNSKLEKLASGVAIVRPDEEDIDQLGREISAENYQVISLLGVGSQGRVYLVRLTSTDQYFALKVFRKDKVLPNEKVR